MRDPDNAPAPAHDDDDAPAPAPATAINEGGTGMTKNPDLLGADHQQRLAGDGVGANQDASVAQAVQEDPVDVLMRMVKTRVQQDGHAAGSKGEATLGELISAAGPGERCLLWAGWFFAGASGAILPSFIWLIGDVFDSFAPGQDPQEARDEIRRTFVLIVALCCAVLVTGTLQATFLAMASARIAARTKSAYLRAVLQQESAWFDLISYTELPARIGREAQSIQRAVGEKLGQIVFSLCMSLGGLALGFAKGWSLALVICAIGPMFMIGMAVFGGQLKKRTVTTMKAYGQSAGYAEQALSAVRVVVAFGMEQTELSSYRTYLERARAAGNSSACSMGLSLGFFLFSIYFAYSYAFLMGAVWVEYGIWNDVNDRGYTAGDSISVFFGVLFGLFALSSTGPSFLAVKEGKAAGNLAKEVIDRKPIIHPDSAAGVEHKLEGQVRFQNVGFVYPSRPDNPVLRDFTHEFQRGKTTAIVGTSGSGKSTIV